VCRKAEERDSEIEKGREWSNIEIENTWEKDK
jgi:hypothetical protein